MDTLPPVRSHAAAPPPPSGSTGPAFGQFLRRAREARGLTLQQVSDETKIPKRHLAALELGNLSAVPSGIYQRAEIRAFAKSVGLDQNVALAQFERLLESSDETTTASTPGSTDESRPRMLAMIGVISIAIAAVSVVAMWTYTREPLTSRQPIPTVPHPTSEAARELPPVPKQAAKIVPQAQPNDVVAALPLSETEKIELTEGLMNGVLIITTEPAGARVTVNGVGWGVTPVTIQNLPNGDHRIRVTKEGYVSAERSVSISNEIVAHKINIELAVRE